MSLFDIEYARMASHRRRHADPFSFCALDLKTYAMAALDTEFVETTKSIMPKEWLTKEHPNVALGDAIEQGETFFAIRKAIKGR